MERELVWNRVYQAIVHVSKGFPAGHAGSGHPDVHPTWVIVVCWFWSCLWGRSMAEAMRELQSRKRRGLLEQGGYRLPKRVPDAGTVSRRRRRVDFGRLVRGVHGHLVDRLLLAPFREVLVVDSSPLDIPTISHDPDARWGHHGHFGYRVHTLMTQDRLFLEFAVEPSNAHELAVAPPLIGQAAARQMRCRYLAGDIGYDSEPLHRCVRAHLGGMLVAPVNHRGGSCRAPHSPLRRAMWRKWNRPRVRKARRTRGEIERSYSLLKGPLALDSLPRHVRHLENVRAFVAAKIIFYHAYLAQRGLAHAA